jgi:omega-amidase
MNKFRLAVLQTRCVANKEQNIQFITKALAEAGSNGANVSVLGEICNSPYVKSYLQEFAEDFDNSPTIKAIQQQSLQYKMYTIGTISRKANDKLFNTAFVINPKGELQTQYDKTHLFDINIPGKITYYESETFSPGNKVCVFDTDYGKMGLGICYDMRFPELALIMAQKGARFLIYPGSFNQTTGPLHWELLIRSRALDTQCFAVGVSVAQYKEDPSIYQAWGHSTLSDPFGRVLIGLD